MFFEMKNEERGGQPINYYIEFILNSLNAGGYQASQTAYHSNHFFDSPMTW